MSATGHYHRRWSAGTAGRTTPTSHSLSSAVEPSTYGTSWNSVRWNKPTTNAYRSHSSTIASRFDQKPSYSASPVSRTTASRYGGYTSGLSSAARTAADMASMGPSVTARASRFDATVRDAKDKYRSEARDLINKWTSRERNGADSLYSSRKTDPSPSYTTSSRNNDYPYRTVSRTPSRSNITVPATSRYSSSRERSTIMSPSPTPQTHTLKVERPWRQRMAESSRIRATHGDDYGSRQGSRESSVYGPTSRFTSSYATPSYQTPREETKSFKYMSRSYSPVRSPVDLFKNSSSSRLSTTSGTLLPDKTTAKASSQESLSLRDESRERHNMVSAVPKNPSIRESSKERDGERRKKSGKERTARRNSRQRSQQLGSSSSEEEVSKEESKRKRRKKRLENSEPPSLPPTSASTSKPFVNGAGQENAEPRIGVPTSIPVATTLAVNLTESEDFHSCAGSPREPISPGMGQKISRSNSKTRLPSKSQIIKSPSVVEVGGVSRADSKTSITSGQPLPSPTMSNSVEMLDDFSQDDQASINSGQEDESKYSAVAHFKPFKAKVKPIAPVPGLWNKPGGEENISKNKAFTKDNAVGSTFIIWKVKRREVVVKKLKSVEKKLKKAETPKSSEKKVATPKVEGKPAENEKNPIKKLFLLKKKTTKETPVKEEKEVKKEVVVPKEENVTITNVLKRSEDKSTVSTTLKDKRRVTVTHPRKIKAFRTEERSVDKSLVVKPASLSARKTFTPKKKSSSSLSLHCLASSSFSVQSESTFVAKPVNVGAQVIVDTPQKGINLTRARLRVKANRRSMPCFSELARKGEELEKEIERARLSTLPNEDGRRSMSQMSLDSQSRAAEFLDEMRGTEPALEWKRDDHDALLVLPDKSILEEYVKRKRGKLERLHSEPIRERDELSGCNSPCNSTTSELLPACAVRVYERSARELPVITAPSRNQSVESSTPTAMLDSIQSSYNNFNSTPQAFFRTNAARVQCAKPIQFEAPRSAFEERLQMQAHAIRKASNASNHSDTEAADSSSRRGSDGMNSITTSFTAAMAEKQGQNRHERYAAHIPMNRGEGSGRQSAASVESSQSGVLDTASKQLDQVIDKARHRHHQHRSKFKEAIDYLDQIFEDLKKECDVSGEDNNNACSSGSNGRPSSQNIESVEFTRRPTAAQLPNQNSKTNSLPNRNQKHHKAVQPPSPVELILAQPSTPPEVAVTETFVLPKKTDKLDFTRRWLQDDLSSLAHQPPPPVILPDLSMYTDVDEHSLGSCSAEVAAINSTKKEKKRTPSKPQLVVPQPAPIRPQPYRPQPKFGAQENNSGSRQFPLELEAPSLQRVASYDHMPERKESQTSNTWRSGSQEPYQTLSSVRSDADSRPSPSAFHNVNVFGQRGAMRSSLRSLPDASVVRGKYHQPTPPKDPVMAIDQLVAELELNTDQPMSAADKRRSFPTSFRPENERRDRMRMEPAGQMPRSRQTNGWNNNQSSYHTPSSAQPQTSSKSSLHRQQKSLDEVATMLNSVVNDFGSSQSRRHNKPHNDNGFSTSNHPLYATPHSLNQSKPFETINQEKINPSRVEAMHNMFERGTGTQKIVPAQNAWKNQPPHTFKQPRDEESYYDTAEFSVRPYKRVSPPRQQHISMVRPVAQASQEYVPAYPLTQPPQHPPPGRNGSANSSTNGGYYSSNSSTAGPAYQQNQPVARRSSLVGRQSMGSRAPSVDDDDDGFYDNIGAFDDRRYSRGSELDVASLSSRQLPPAHGKSNKIGSFLRKIGGSRPPGSAASLISLNKVANETPIKTGVLMKSNSLSNEPWRKQILEQSMPREATPSKGGLGTRLKNSLFGSKKRLNA